MGIFSDKCRALIDPSTGRVLTGEALARAKSDPKWPRCGHRVRKAARFCSKCGAGAPGGWSRCPSCGKWVGNESSYCWNCDTPLYPDERAGISGGVWRKDGMTFAQRFETGDVKRLLKEGLQIQAGTVALLMDAGRFRGILEPGRHQPENLLRTINHFGDPPPRSVVLVDAGDVILPVRLEGLRSSEALPLEFYGELIVRFNQKQPQTFLENCLKDARRLTYDEVTEPLRSEIRHAVSALCTTSTIEDLVKDPERRLRLEDELRRTLEELLARRGLELIRVSAAEFTGDEYEELVDKQGTLEAKRRELEFDQRMRELLSRDRMHEFKTEQDLEEYIAQRAHERGVSDAKRDRETALMKRGWAHEDELDDLRHRIGLEQEETAHQIDIKVRWDDYEREKSIRDAETDARVKAIHSEQEQTETRAWLEIRKIKDRLKAEAKQADADRRKGMSFYELLIDVEDDDLRKDLIKALSVKTQAEQSPEQILAALAGSSPAAAEALARMAEAQTSSERDKYEELKRLYSELSEQQRASLETMIRPVIEAAKRTDGNQTIVR